METIADQLANLHIYFWFLDAAPTPTYFRMDMFLIAFSPGLFVVYRRGSDWVVTKIVSAKMERVMNW